MRLCRNISHRNCETPHEHASFLVPVEQQISRETNDRLSRKQLGKLRRDARNINENSDQPACTSCCGTYLM